jgi:hypothetical protein
MLSNTIRHIFYDVAMIGIGYGERFDLDSDMDMTVDFIPTDVIRT